MNITFSFDAQCDDDCHQYADQHRHRAVDENRILVPTFRTYLDICSRVTLCFVSGNRPALFGRSPPSFFGEKSGLAVSTFKGTSETNCHLVRAVKSVVVGADYAVVASREAQVAVVAAELAELAKTVICTLKIK